MVDHRSRDKSNNMWGCITYSVTSSHMRIMVTTDLSYQFTLIFQSGTSQSRNHIYPPGKFPHPKTNLHRMDGIFRENQPINEICWRFQAIPGLRCCEFCPSLSHRLPPHPKNPWSHQTRVILSRGTKYQTKQFHNPNLGRHGFHFCDGEICDPLVKTHSLLLKIAHLYMFWKMIYL